jgi:lysophospholipase L1-like esterase
MHRIPILLLTVALAATAVEIHPNVFGSFDKVVKDKTGQLVPAGWTLNTAFAANGTWGAVPDAQRGGYALAVTTERGPIHVFTEKGVSAGPGTKVKVEMQARGAGSFHIWLYCYGTTGGWVGDNVAGPTVKLAGDAWQKQSFDPTIPTKPFPKGTVGQIKLAIEVAKGSKLEFDNAAMTMEVEMESPKANAAGPNLRLLLPPVMYATPGLETNLYFANTILAINPANYAFDVTCSKGIQQEERWTFTPKPEDAGECTLTLTIRDDTNTIIAAATTLVRVVPSKAEASLHVLMIGDSLTHASYYPAQVLANAEADESLDVVLIGSHRPRGEDSPVRHEGYGGWTAQGFVSKWDKVVDPKRRSRSPFLYQEGDTAPKLDFPRYCREQNDGKAPDAVTIFLGCNDVFGADDDSIADRAGVCIENLERLVQMIHDFAPQTQIGFLLPVPPAGTQDAFAANYACGQTRWQCLRNQHYLLEQMLKTFGDREAKGVYLLPAFTALDTIHGFPTKTAPVNSRSKVEIARLNNGVHPAESGYQQIGDVVSAWLVFLANR